MERIVAAGELELRRRHSSHHYADRLSTLDGQPFFLLSFFLLRLFHCARPRDHISIDSSLPWIVPLSSMRQHNTQQREISIESCPGWRFNPQSDSADPAGRQQSADYYFLYTRVEIERPAGVDMLIRNFISNHQHANTTNSAKRKRAGRLIVSAANAESLLVWLPPALHYPFIRSDLSSIYLPDLNVHINTFPAIARMRVQRKRNGGKKKKKKKKKFRRADCFLIYKAYIKIIIIKKSRLERRNWMIFDWDIVLSCGLNQRGKGEGAGAPSLRWKHNVSLPVGVCWATTTARLLRERGWAGCLIKTGILMSNSSNGI